MLNEPLNAGQHKRISIYQTHFVVVPLFSKSIITRQIILSTKNSQEFLASQVSVLRRKLIKPPTPVLLTVYFPAALKALVLGNLFNVCRLDITFAREVCHSCGDKDEENMTIVLFFSLSPTAKFPCECDGKSNKVE